MGSALDFLGIARKAGFLEIGEEAAGFAVRAGKARALLLASDASPNAVRRAEAYTRGTKIPLTQTPFTKEEIGLRVGKHGCSMIAVMDFGLAAEILDDLARGNPERYGEVAAFMRAKSDRAQRRRQGKEGSGQDRTLGKRRK